MKKLLPIIAIILSVAMLLTGCTGGAVASVNLMDGIVKKNKEAKKPDYMFSYSQYNITMSLIKEMADDKENFFVSPASLSMALGIALNGAEGKTKEELEAFLCNGYSSERFNEYIKYYGESLGKDIKSFASIWYRNDYRLSVNKDFLQINANYYGADAYKIPFDNSGKDIVNNWVKEKTDGNIESIIDEIEKDSMMLLINALTFDASWQNPYNEKAVEDGIFYANDEKYDVKMMNSTEDMYINYNGATGFIKPYKNADYLFAAILPEENTSLEDYIKNMDGEKLKNTINSASEATVHASLPKFSFNYSFTADKFLKNSGINAAFDEKKADFSSMAKATGANLYMGSVLQKTYIDVNENGTKAGAVTKVEMIAKSSISPSVESVVLNRPFIFLILDGNTKTPIFAGAVNKF